MPFSPQNTLSQYNNKETNTNTKHVFSHFLFSYSEILKMYNFNVAWKTGQKDPTSNCTVKLNSCQSHLSNITSYNTTNTQLCHRQLVHFHHRKSRLVIHMKKNDLCSEKPMQNQNMKLYFHSNA